jgi:hypothetical protein
LIRNDPAAPERTVDLYAERDEGGGQRNARPIANGGMVELEAAARRSRGG